MSEIQDQREELPAPNRKFGYRHLFPIVKVLMQRGHLPIGDRDRYGFSGGQGLTKCHLTHPLTEEDWAAVTERFVIPDNIVWRFGFIRDHDNRAQIQGDSIIISGGKEVPIEEWMAREDWSDLPPY